MLKSSAHQSSGARRVLGVRWDISTDQFVMSLEDLTSTATDLEPTKRSVVSLEAKLYDPLSFPSAVVIQFKIFLQALCKIKLPWDDPLAGDLLEKWQCLLQSLIKCQQIIQIPRCYPIPVQEQPGTHKLCGFCDASLRAYAEVMYLVVESEAGYHVDFVASKTQVSPLTQQTIPGLELL